MKVDKKAVNDKKTVKDKKSVKPAKGRATWFPGLKVQLLIGFMIPVCIVALVGNYAYNKAANGMLNNYGDSAQTAIQMTATLLDFGFQSVDSDSIEIFNDSNLKDYASDKYKNDPGEKNNAYAKAETLIRTKQTSNSFIQNIIVVTADSLNDIATTAGQGDKTGYYAKFTEEGSAYINANDKAYAWAGEHPVVDERFHTSTDNYICSQYRQVSSKNACVVIDVSTSRIQEVLAELNLGEGSIVAFVTADGRELNADSTSEFTFYDKDYYKEAANAEESFYSCYVKYEGEEYLFMYGRCDTNLSGICALTPKDELMKEAINMRSGIFMWVIIACVIVLIVGIIIMLGISKKIGSITRRLKKVSEGDLTVDMRINDRAEFGKLAQHIMDTISNTKHVIAKVKDVSGQVNHSVSSVKKAGEQLEVSTVNIQGAMDEIAKGVGQQALDAERCLEKTAVLSEKILSTSEKVKEMGVLANGTHKMIQEGTAQMQNLTVQAEETGQITGLLSEQIGNLNQKMNSIQSLIDAIDEISDETALLSLNASIEAARAGESGRGFAVVADSIKKLADNSKVSSDEIRKVIVDINSVFDETQEVFAKVGEMVENQESTVKATQEMFNEMKTNMDKLLDNISHSVKDMNEMDSNRNDTLASIQSISAVSEETAASAENITVTVGNQTLQVEQLSDVMEELENKMKELLDVIEKFTV